MPRPQVHRGPRKCEREEEVILSAKELSPAAAAAAAAEVAVLAAVPEAVPAAVPAQSLPRLSSVSFSSSSSFEEWRSSILSNVSMRS